ncbi:MAG TPA: ribosomal RNA small subunit methyltransferase A [Planctomycetaceae bacterium]|nr:ribosomal RNA small subunit methyltransferase A [Planctomycetaceae bacterium]HIQ19908.1 ribosomal RNA small subunit methyltransferase A [Planctomycetota bacterium]
MARSKSASQTRSFLMRRFAEAGIQPRTKLGQNFLIDLNLQRLLVNSAELEPCDVVLEVGTGTGSLTAQMAGLAASVVTVELDADLFRLAEEQLHDLPNVRMLHADALKNKNRLNPQVLAAVEEQLAVDPRRRFKLVANLPYQVATPILTNLLALERPPRTMTITIQKELADRIVAAPATKDYGALSIWVQSQCRVRIVRVMPPSVFWPRPKVSSAIVHVVLDDALRSRIPDRVFFHGFVRAMFFHRRKFLRSELRSVLKKIGKAEVDRIMAALGLEATARAEQLDVETMLALAERCRQRVAAVGGEAMSGEKGAASDAVH